MGERSATFSRSDIRGAAEEFVSAISEHSEFRWHDADEEALAESLTDAAFVVLRTPESAFAVVLP